MSGYGEVVARRRWAESRHIPLAPCEAQSANKNCSIYLQERQRLEMAMGKILQGEGPTHSWQVHYIRPIPVAPRAYKWDLVRLDTYSELGFSYPVVDANAQHTIN